MEGGARMVTGGGGGRVGGYTVGGVHGGWVLCLAWADLYLAWPDLYLALPA